MPEKIKQSSNSGLKWMEIKTLPTNINGSTFTINAACYNIIWESKESNFSHIHFVHSIIFNGYCVCAAIKIKQEKKFLFFGFKKLFTKKLFTETQ